jgi:cellulose synthase operon protein YhjU
MQGFIPEKPHRDRLGTFFITWWCWYFLNMSFGVAFNWYLLDFWQQFFLGVSACVPFSQELKHYRLINNVRHFLSTSFAIAIAIEKINTQIFLNFLSSKTIISTTIWLGTILIALFFSLSSFKKWYPLIIAGCVGVALAAASLDSTSLPGTTASSDLKVADHWTEPFAQPQSLQPPTSVPAPASILKIDSPDELLNRFYQQEAENRIVFSKPTTPFDIIILQTCSLGWEDLNEAKIDPRSFFSQFDFLFTNFNSGDTYSIASAIRLLRGACGQGPRKNLYEEVSIACFPFESLRSFGYKTFTAYNHRGDYFGFDRDVGRFGRADPPMNIATLKSERSFFGTTDVYRNYDVLKLWLNTHRSDEFPLALYYNTLTLHSRSYPSKNEEWKHNNISTFQTSYRNLTTDLNLFFKDLSASNRRAIVVVVGEHGAALKETKLQGQTVREIPTPGVSLVPAAIKLFGPEFNSVPHNKSVTIKEPSGYPALYTLINSLLSSKVSDLDQKSLGRFSFNLPTLSQFVVSNNFGTTIRLSDELYYKTNDGKKWEKLPQSIKVPDIIF